MRKEPASFISLLLETAQPDLYRRNAFRVLNLDVRAPASDIKRQLRRMELERNFGVGNAASQKTTIELLLSPPPDAEMIAEAKSRLEDVERRFIDEFFAGWAGQNGEAGEVISPEHDGAVMFHALALDIELSAHKLSTDMFTESLKEQRDGYWRKAIYLWQHALNDARVWDHLMLRVDEIGDPRLAKETVRRMRENLPLALSMISARLAARASQLNDRADSRRHARIMQEIAPDSEVAAEALRRATDPLCHHINDLCKTFGREALSAQGSADQSVEYLLERARPLLLAVDDLLPKDNPQRATAFDAVAATANDAILLKSNTLSPAAAPEWEAIQRQFERLAHYAATPSLRDIINKNIEWSKGNAQRSMLARCWFCSKREAQDWSAVGVRLYQWQRENFYHYYDLPVPRCADCSPVHDHVAKLAQRGAIAGGIAGGLISLGLLSSFWETAMEIIWDRNTFNPVLAGLLVVGIIILIIGTALVSEFIISKVAWSKAPEGIKPLKDMMKFPAIDELKAKGWSLHKPSS